jgi:nucleobase transporter 1/2
LVVFTLYMENVYFPFPNLLKKYHDRNAKTPSLRVEKSTIKVHLFKLFPVLITIICIWFISFLCTYFDVLEANDPARTDGHKTRLIHDSPFFRIPMPFQWGWPMVSTSAVIGVFCAVLISIFESVGDYYACAKLCEAPAPPKHVINRGILTEGIGMLNARCTFFFTIISLISDDLG